MNGEVIIDGKAVAADIRAEIKVEVAKRAKQGRQPGLAVIVVGDDPASKVYVNMKKKACEETGMASLIERMPADTTQSDLLARVREINEDDRFNGLLVQSPLPNGLDENEVVRAIDPMKDVDGFHPENVGLLALNQPRFVPCTPSGVMELLKRYNVDPSGKQVVVLGRSHLVGMPMALLLMRKAKGANATVTVCHSRTINMAEQTRRADILIAAIGQPHFVKGDMVKEGAVVIDVGINRVDDALARRGYRLVGDVDYNEVRPKTSAITPVPGGVGPMTVALLLKNTLYAEELHHHRE
ncbi:MAG TPA: bifunctional methylenetetrahydrofolate dehydrogenase/methenyltetrahydrofolate cyclohydrolase FolD [Bacteroidetes bacterium]|nr:bifunctional methylenetetrahydrofolate dehydrogenase/methenyltetrahydrofolate cyclohydrolase FolD [Bacteroidota bacterium]HEX03791.1 bifunctional methylenetetrahydrofolate dehydrogenase/methenyltetrahydrofolate cyclohydrolase FolD [Bacteroidota bacterium]